MSEATDVLYFISAEFWIPANCYANPCLAGFPPE